MSVRCEECNYENDPQHSFCGMCGAKLRSRRQAAREREEAQAFSRPSLLGLADSDPPQSEGAEYLLEDEPGGEHRKALLALVVLVIALAAVGFHYRTPIRAWIAQAGKNPNAALTADVNALPGNAPGATQNAAASPQPPSAASATPETGTPANAPGTAQTTATSAQPQPPAANTAPESGPGAAASTTPPVENKAVPTPPPASAAANQPAAPNPAVTNAATREAETQPEAPPKPVIKSAATKVEYQSSAKTASAETLETQGEDYLYGRGVPADCGLATKDLLAAAHTSTKAQTVLGTMYATGHCVPHDALVAYRWFAKAQRQSPGNRRLEDDMRVLWNQMTSEQQEIALKAEE